MDIYCGKCGEPWDIDTLHDVADDQGSTFTAISREFRTQGCRALDASCNAETLGTTRAHVASVMGDLLGDDVDGFASIMDDYAYLVD